MQLFFFSTSTTRSTSTQSLVSFHRITPYKSLHWLKFTQCIIHTIQNFTNLVTSIQQTFFIYSPYWEWLSEFLLAHLQFPFSNAFPTLPAQNSWHLPTFNLQFLGMFYRTTLSHFLKPILHFSHYLFLNFISSSFSLLDFILLFSLSLFRLSLFFFQHNFCVKPYVPREPRRDPSNRRLYEHGIYIRHCQESNSQPVSSQVRADPTRPQWQTLSTGLTPRNFDLIMSSFIIPFVSSAQLIIIWCIVCQNMPTENH